MTGKMTFAKQNEFSRFCDSYQGAHILQADEDIHAEDLAIVAAEYAQRGQAHRENAVAIQERVNALTSALQGEHFTRTVEILLLSKEHELDLARAWEMKASIITGKIIPLIHQHSLSVEQEYYDMLGKIDSIQSQTSFSKQDTDAAIRDIITESRTRFGELGNHFHTMMPSLMASLSTGSAAPPHIPELPPETIPQNSLHLFNASHQGVDNHGAQYGGIISHNFNFGTNSSPPPAQGFLAQTVIREAYEHAGVEISAASGDSYAIGSLGSSSINSTSQTNSSIISSSTININPNWISASANSHISVFPKQDIASGGSNRSQSMNGGRIAQGNYVQVLPEIRSSTPKSARTLKTIASSSSSHSKQKFHINQTIPSRDRVKKILIELTNSGPHICLAQVLLASIRELIYAAKNTPTRSIQPCNIAISLIRLVEGKMLSFFYSEQNRAYIQLPLKLPKILLNLFRNLQDVDFSSILSGLPLVLQAVSHTQHISGELLTTASSVGYDPNQHQSLAKDGHDKQYITYQSDELFMPRLLWLRIRFMDIL